MGKPNYNAIRPMSHNRNFGCRGLNIIKTVQAQCVTHQTLVLVPLSALMVSGVQLTLLVSQAETGARPTPSNGVGRCVYGISKETISFATRWFVQKCPPS